ncbi:hypothetical protein K9L67_01200 [Candidatus Woesearchaeota archaeon]|nr:hypothetical protein [Candidatus Woesearchaeota archaeon]MCF7900820.1 hypothetical protein [Candidatus Woesearchaeota archaeon]
MQRKYQKIVCLENNLVEKMKLISFFKKAFIFLRVHITLRIFRFLWSIRFLVMNLFNIKKDAIIGVWDFSCGTMGDALLFHEILACLKEEFAPGKNNVEVCFIHDETQDKNVYSDNWKKMISDTVHFNKYLGKIHNFNSYDEFRNYLNSSKKSYVVWPSKNGFVFPYDMNIIIRFFSLFKRIPSFSSPKNISDKVGVFLKEQIYPALPIVVSLRNLKSRHNHRNSDISVLYHFFKHFKSDDRYKFIIICSKEEVDDSLRLNNVLFSKDYFKSIQEDYVIIQKSYAGIFPTSGPAIIAYFDGIPFIQYGFDMNNTNHSPVLSISRSKKFVFLNHNQRIFWKKEELTWLLEEFDKLLKDIEQYNKKVKK